jgi:hypothetical protein
MQALVNKPKSPQPDSNPTPVALKTSTPQAPIKRLPPKPTDKPISVEQMLDDLQSIMMAVNCGSNELQKFSAHHPYLIAPNIYGVWSDTLKETSISLLREYQRLRNRHNG